MYALECVTISGDSEKMKKEECTPWSMSRYQQTRRKCYPWIEEKEDDEKYRKKEGDERSLHPKGRPLPEIGGVPSMAVALMRQDQISGGVLCDFFLTPLIFEVTPTPIQIFLFCLAMSAHPGDIDLLILNHKEISDISTFPVHDWFQLCVPQQTRQASEDDKTVVLIRHEEISDKSSNRQQKPSFRCCVHQSETAELQAVLSTRSLQTAAAAAAHLLRTESAKDMNLRSIQTGSRLHRNQGNGASICSAAFLTFLATTYSDNFCTSLNKATKPSRCPLPLLPTEMMKYFARHTTRNCPRGIRLRNQPPHTQIFFFCMDMSKHPRDIPMHLLYREEERDGLRSVQMDVRSPLETREGTPQSVWRRFCPTVTSTSSKRPKADAPIHNESSHAIILFSFYTFFSSKAEIRYVCIVNPLIGRVFKTLVFEVIITQPIQMPLFSVAKSSHPRDPRPNCQRYFYLRHSIQALEGPEEDVIDGESWGTIKIPNSSPRRPYTGFLSVTDTDNAAVDGSTIDMASRQTILQEH
ncbi:unnamed protein product [Cyprideis torosa]|uniref:Uncharacterized protein n=1 Tax=Cyprideis torosa TaxID=163714 RepID=A0A7R8WFI5_9CRUS|nr:unnamed protein product [Cyprideis torosa]CAG0897025.1 unnamed protein product [Cyprideis torosa]